MASAKEKKRALDALAEIDKGLASVSVECNKALEAALQQHLNDRDPILKRR